MNCNLIAPYYQTLEYLVFGRALEQRRLQYMAETTNAESVLVLGDGDGRFIADYCISNQTASIDCVDLSSSMLHLTRKRVHSQELNTNRIRLIQADAKCMSLQPGKYDLIITHFFLDCFTPAELSSLIASISRCARAQSRWLISEFCIPDYGFLRWFGTVLIKAMYVFFGITTGLKVRHLPNYANLLTLNGFQRTRCKTTWGGLITSELWERV